jgi:hypothetical protein
MTGLSLNLPWIERPSSSPASAAPTTGTTATIYPFPFTTLIGQTRRPPFWRIDILDNPLTPVSVDWNAYWETLGKVAASHGRTLSSFDQKVAQAVFKACSDALQDHHKDNEVWRVIAAPTGSGKTTAALAFGASLVDAGGSFLFLAGTKRECDAAFRLLQGLLGNRVAIRTTDHDKAKLEEQGQDYTAKTLSEGGYKPSAFFRREELSNFGALIGTHEGYKQRPESLEALASGSLRQLVLVDERPDDVDIADFTLSDIERLHEAAKDLLGVDDVGDEHALVEALATTCLQLSALLVERPSAEGHTWTQFGRLPLEVPQAWQIGRLRSDTGLVTRLTHTLRWEASEVQRAGMLLEQALKGYAFMARNTQFSRDARFVAYEPNWPKRAGTVLMDATSDIDGYAELVSTRLLSQVPEADYRHLEIIHLDGPQQIVGAKIKEEWKKAGTRDPLLRWMHKAVLSHSKAGEKVLVVTWKDIIAGGLLQVLDWEGRELDYCHFGIGIGSNRWRECSAVVIFGEYHKPRRTTVAETHGIKDTAFDDTKIDATIQTLKGDYRITQQGHLLRWLKQMAMRGRARELDTNGIASPMRLCFMGDYSRLLEQAGRLFPGAKAPISIKVEADEPQVSTKRTKRKSVADDVLKYLSTTTKDQVTSSELQADTGIALKTHMKRLNGPAFRESLGILGWLLIPARGRGNQTRFERGPKKV